ncbi:MAG TPA: HepT-like ribonuclease domain-containing protein [Thermoplasmata archaeon]|nr:HepT-like ribonuclease domain-containing protein [Thermoplasmata archaeon]
MIQAIEEVTADVAEGREAFLRPGLVQKAVLLDLIHLTESAEKTSRGFKSANPSIPWSRLSKLRNVGLVHEYLEVNLEELWTFIRDELPSIRRKLARARYTDLE